jgi:hypothetical protein
MSALPPKADIVQRRGNVRFVPKADICGAAKIAPFDHLVNARKQRGGIASPSPLLVLCNAKINAGSRRLEWLKLLLLSKTLKCRRYFEGMLVDILVRL